MEDKQTNAARSSAPVPPDARAAGRSMRTRNLLLIYTLCTCCLPLGFPLALGRWGCSYWITGVSTLAVLIFVCTVVGVIARHLASRRLLIGGVIAFNVCLYLGGVIRSRVLGNSPGLPVVPPPSEIKILIFGLALTMLMALGAWGVAGRRQRRVGRYPPHCEVCGYSLIGLSEARCPECGSSFPAQLLGSCNADDGVRAPGEHHRG